MPSIPHFNLAWLSRLLASPERHMQGVLDGHAYRAAVLIPDFPRRLMEHYRDIIGGDFKEFCVNAEIPCKFENFGISIDFQAPAELQLHDADMRIDANLCEIMDRVGPIIIRNAYVDAVSRSMGHRNKFPHLNFHVDRTSLQETVYSMYTRDPFDEEQKLPRTSSTLFVANIAGHLQGIRDGLVGPADKGVRATYNLFKGENISALVNEMLVEHRWDFPEGQGEISMLDNRTCLHASYYREAHGESYKIGVRYLAGNR